MKSMIRALAALAAALVFAGCGGDVYQDGADSDLGQAKQAIVYDDGYGIDGAQNRCWYDNGNGGWAGGYCRMPNGLNWLVVIPDANKTAGCDPDTRVGASNAAIDFRSYMNDRGWNITVKTTSELASPLPFDAHAATVTCANPADHSVGAETLGTTQLPVEGACALGSFAGVKCLDAGARGTVISYDATRGPYMFEMRWKAKSYWSGKTSTQKRRFARNLIIHELFHQVGLGHDTFAETHLMGLQDNITYAFDHVLWPTTYESNLLSCVNPNRDGLFQRCL